MTILIIDNSTAFTGAFKCALNEAVLLSSEHRFVFVMSANSTLVPMLRDKGITVHTLPMVEISKSISGLTKYPFILASNTMRLRKIIKQEQVHVVQVNDFYNLLGAGSKLLNSKLKLLTYVRFVPASMPSALRKLWITVAQRYSQKVIAVSDTVLHQLPYHPDTIRVYDPANFEEKILSANARSNDTVTLLYLSNYIRGKGQDYALEAFIKAYAENDKLRLKFCGGDMGLEKNRLFKNLLQEKVTSLGLQDVVHFDPFSSNIEKEIKSADILLNFSDSESFSMTCLEASYYGTPVIATRCGGPEEIIDDNKTGLLVHKADIDGMCRAILQLAGDDAMRKRYAAAAMQYVRSKFSTVTFKEQFENILKQGV